MPVESAVHLAGVVLASKDPLELATGLLRLGRDRADEFTGLMREARNIAARDRLVRITAETLAARLRAEGLSIELRKKLLELLGADPDVPEVVRARALALALDQAARSEIRNAFRDVDEVHLKPGDPVPTSQPYHDLLGSSTSAHPGSMDDTPDRISSLCLAPERVRGTPHFVLDGRLRDILAPLSDPEHQTLAAGVPNRTYDEFEGQDWEESGVHFFFPFRPRNPENQGRRLAGLLALGRDAGATILVLPELCSDEIGARALIEEFQTKPGSLRLLVAGSYHAGARTDPQRDNVCLAAVRGLAEPLQHRKFSRFFFRRRKGGEESEYHEGLLPTAEEVRIYMGDSWTFTFLICKDFLTMKVRHALMEMGVSLFLLPMLSPKTAEFEEFAGALAMANQGVVVAANNPIFPDGSRTHAVFSLPTGDSPTRVHPPFGSGIGLTWLRASPREEGWLDLPANID